MCHMHRMCCQPVLAVNIKARNHWIPRSRAGACTYDERNMVLMSDISQSLEIGDAAPRVADTLDKEQLGLLVDVLGILLPCLQLGPSHLNTQAREQGLEQAVGASIQVDRSHDIVTGSREADDGVENGGLTGTCAHGRSSSL